MKDEARFALSGALLSIVLAGPAAAADKPLALGVTDKSLQWGACPPIFKGDCKIAILHGDPAKPNADVLLRVGPGTSLPRHKHSSAERMMLARGRLWVRYDGSRAIVLNRGDYAYGPAGLPHAARCIGTAPCYLFVAFEGPVDAELVR